MKDVKDMKVFQGITRQRKVAPLKSFIPFMSFMLKALDSLTPAA
jgi:hypothetical protein